MGKNTPKTQQSDRLDAEILQGYPGLMSALEVREVLHIGRTGVYALLKSGEIPSITIRGKYRIPKQYLLDYLIANTCGEGH